MKNLERTKVVYVGEEYIDGEFIDEGTGGRWFFETAEAVRQWMGKRYTLPRLAIQDLFKMEDTVEGFWQDGYHDNRMIKITAVTMFTTK